MAYKIEKTNVLGKYQTAENQNDNAENNNFFFICQ